MAVNAKTCLCAGGQGLLLLYGVTCLKTECSIARGTRHLLCVDGVWGMKRVEMEGFFIVHSGEPWPHEALPCSRSMVKHLERNESVVTWLQASVSP